jgi:hypothetical protein
MTVILYSTALISSSDRTSQSETRPQYVATCDGEYSLTAEREGERGGHRLTFGVRFVGLILETGAVN